MNCEQVRVAAMALADGETAPLPRSAIEAHVIECAACRQEIRELDGVGRVWETQARRTQTVDLWPQVQQRLERGVARSERRWQPALVAMLVAFKLLTFIPERSFGTWVQFVPLLMAASAFALVGQNPFQIKTKLRSQEESL